ncbi:MAG: hypothetical protein WAJ85_13830 [Candidatus Baltobacteraceae bacterium]
MPRRERSYIAASRTLEYSRPVDCIVVAEPEDHWQTFGERYNPAFSGEIKVPVRSIPPLPLDERKVIARRAALELKPNGVINLGISVPEG